MVGICGPQACGKTAACIKLCEKLKEVVHLSLDDFYLPFGELEALYEQTNFDPLYRFRGNAGSHNTNLLQSTLTALKTRNATVVPVFDKTLRNGFGDRSGYKTIKPADVIILEGWLIGFKPHENVPNKLGNVNKFLNNYKDATQLIDILVVIKVEDVKSMVRKWRVQAPGMPKDSPNDFLNIFEPAYEEYYDKVDTDFEGLATYVLQMDVDRKVQMEI